MDLCNRQTNLRDIKKEQTANELAEAAFELATQKGLDGFVVKDIVDRAGYSRRTFANYFTCKEEAVVMAVLHQKGVSKVEDFIATIDEDTLPIDILYELMKMQFTTSLLKKMKQVFALSKKYPTLEPYILSVFQYLQGEAIKIVKHFSKGRYPKEYPYLLGGALYGVMLPLLGDKFDNLFSDQSSNSETESVTFKQYLDKAFTHLRNGF